MKRILMIALICAGLQTMAQDTTKLQYIISGVTSTIFSQDTVAGLNTQEVSYTYRICGDQSFPAKTDYYLFTYKVAKHTAFSPTDTMMVKLKDYLATKYSYFILK